MRLLVVGHTYLTAFAQRKYIEMKHLQADLELRILTPRSMPHVFQRYAREVAQELTSQEVIDIRHYFGRSHMSYVLDPIALAAVLRQFRPTHIHIEEDPYSAVGVETVAIARLVCRDAQISFFIWDNLAREPRFPLNVLKWRLNRFSLKRADLVICGNKEGERLLRGKKGYTGRTAVLPQLGLDPALYLESPPSSIRAELGISRQTPLIGYVGRFIAEKGVFHLLEALRELRHRPSHALFIGAGPLEEEIRNMGQRYLGSRFTLRKAVPHAEVPGYMRAMDILVLPSYATNRWKEQFGLVLAQAMLAGVPCIGSSSGAIPDVIGPGGLVFQERNVGDLRVKLDQLLSSSEARESFGKAAQEFAIANYTNEAVAKGHLAEFTRNKQGHQYIPAEA
jgi:glycosyltransferase involved in cell wall biosynthesis